MFRAFGFCLVLYMLNSASTCLGDLRIAQRTLVRRAPSSSSPAVSEVSLLTQAYNGFQGQTSFTSSRNGSLGPDDTVTTARSDTPNSKNPEAVCEFGAQLISGLGDCSGATTTIVGPKISDVGLKHECLLWDSSCSGNNTSALNDFFDNTVWFLEETWCFSQPELDGHAILSNEKISEYR